jgi:N-acylneuraminate cytidylyltransferase/CMP-N,N'-diacetyllegionaminic acid synthase
MYNGKKILSFIGARSGSKGLKNKNIIDFAGKPLINWTIDASLNSKYIDHTIVSTDSKAIAGVARDAGANVPFLRPSEISGDDSPLLDAISHSLGWIRENTEYLFDFIILLQPTSPLRTAEYIDQAIEYYFDKKGSETDTLVSVTQMSDKYGWIVRATENGYIDYCFGLNRLNEDRQCLGKYYLPNGAIYIGNVQAVLRDGFYTDRTLYFIMSAEDSVDIDTQEDLEKGLGTVQKRTVEKR